MKTQIITLLFCALSLLAHTKSNIRTNEKIFCLLVRAKILCDAPGTVQIELMVNNQIVDSFSVVGKRKKFELLLKPDLYYTIKITNKLCRTQLICFDTRNFNFTDYDLYEFSFETTLLISQSVSIVNEETKDYPLAIIYYDKKTDKFEYNKAYTARIKKTILESSTTMDSN